MTPKVALIAPRYAPAIGGVERVVEMQARELTRRGIGLEVITTDPTRQLPSREERDGIAVHRFPTVANDSVYFVSPWLGSWLHKHASEFSVLHAHSYHTPLAFQAVMAGRRSGVPVVVTTHYHGTGHTRLRRLLHTPYRPIGAWVLRRARWVLCVSRVEQALLRRHFGASVRTMVTPNAIDADELAAARRPRQANHGLSVLSVGRLDRYKQPERIVAALPHLPGRARVTVVGDGPASAQVRCTAEAFGVCDQVALTGHEDRAALLERYAEADVFVSLSRHESFGLAVLEAAVAGLPVVASDIPAHREVATYTAPGRITLVDPDCTPRRLADALVAAAGRGRVADIDGWPLPTWSRHGDLLLACYQSLAEVPA